MKSEKLLKARPPFKYYDDFNEPISSVFEINSLLISINFKLIFQNENQCHFANHSS